MDGESIPRYRSVIHIVFKRIKSGSDWLSGVSRDQEEAAVLVRLEELANEQDPEGEGQLTEEQLTTAVNSLHQIKVSIEEVKQAVLQGTGTRD